MEPVTPGYLSKAQEPSIQSLISQLKQCGKRKDLQQGKHLHSYATQLGWNNNIYVTSTLISMYSKCGDTQEARDIFEKLPVRNVVSWTSLCHGYVDNGMYLESLDVFHRMDCAPNAFTFATALKACTGLDKKLCLQKGLDVHRKAWKLGLDRDLLVASTLVDMYSKVGEMQMAREVFDGMTHRDVVTWNVLILGYMENGECVAVLETFNEMDCAPNGITISSVLKACASLAGGEKEGFLLKGISIHERAKVFGLDREMVVSSALVDMYCKCGDMRRAQSVFRRMKHRNVVVWTCLVDGYVENGESLEALKVFEEMDCTKNHVTFVAALKACVALAVSNELDKESCLRKGVFLHAQAKDMKLDTELVVANVLVEMYCKLGRMIEARHVFDRMTTRDVISWTVLILGYVENEQSLTALEVFYRMECPPDNVTVVAALKACRCSVSSNWLDNETGLQVGMAIHRVARELGLERKLTVASALVDMYSHCGDMHLARVVFDGMSRRETLTWTVLITGYVENGESSLALEVFRSMDCEADSVTFVAALRACSNMGALDAGQMVHDLVCKAGCEQDPKVANSLVDFYGKCGRMDTAEDIFDRMSSRDVVSWNALIGGYSSLGRSSQVFASVKRMQESGVQANDVTMQLVLAACSHGGFVDEGRRYFHSMPKYGIVQTVKHYACMVDMLGRAGRLEEALALVRGMGERANGVVWMTLLDACRRRENIEIGEVAFKAVNLLNSTSLNVDGPDDPG